MQNILVIVQNYVLVQSRKTLRANRYLNLSALSILSELRMSFIDILQKWSIQILGLILIIVPGGIFVANISKGNFSNWYAYILIISFGALLSGHKSIWKAVSKRLH